MNHLILNIESKGAQFETATIDHRDFERWSSKDGSWSHWTAVDPDERYPVIICKCGCDSFHIVTAHLTEMALTAKCTECGTEGAI